MVDQGLSKGVILCPCNKMIDAEGTIKLYINNVFIQFGLPDTIISDRGPQFASNIFNGILDAIGIRHRMSTTYHPQTDGQTERYNQELEAYLWIYCAYKLDDWSNKLSLAQFAHNARMHDAIKQLEFKSPVQFRFFCLFWNNCDCDQSQKIPEMEKTRLNHL